MRGNDAKSHPARGGWIEIGMDKSEIIESLRPTPHGVGGLKWKAVHINCVVIHVPPRTGWVD